MAASPSISTSTPMNMKAQDQLELRALPGNDRCIDCGRRSPQWASATLSVFMCLECSGQHRSLGTHVSFVRSVKMDSWSPKQIASMRAGGGNDACRAFLADKGGIDTSVLGSASIPEKYDTPAGQLFQQVIKARVEGTPEPTELPESSAGSDDSDGESADDDGGGGKKKLASIRGEAKVMEGFGSSPHPKHKKRRWRRILGSGVAVIGAIATVGLSRRKGKKPVSRVSLSTRV